MEDENNQKILKYRYIYSPRTTYNNKLIEEDKLYKELFKAIDPYSIKILKKHFKERLGNINKETFICILKNHLITWNYSLQNREEILIKLLSRLFEEIDINSNGLLDWNEFMNYTINAGSSNYHNDKNIKDPLYSIQKYIPCQKNLNYQDNKKANEIKFNYMSSTNKTVCYSFYIEKYKLFGIVHDGQSQINFYNMETHAKSLCEIDLLQIEDKIYSKILNKLSKKSELLLKREIKEQNNVEKKDENNRILTPDNVRKEINSINKEEKIDSKNRINNNFKKERNFFAQCAIFVEECDLLFISSSNNIISAWKYNKYKNEFKNINNNNSEERDLEELSMPLFMSELPQYSICYDYELKCIYSGQEDGKIFKWDIHSNKPVHTFEISKIVNNKINKTIKNKKIKNKNKDEYDKNIMKDKKQYIIMENKNTKFGIAQSAIKELKKNLNLINYDYNRETVSCLLLINKLRILCSGYYNGNIILWDILTYEPKIIYNDQKTGIYQLEYNINKNHIYSCGFDHNIYVYDPYHENNSIYKFRGHLASVNSISLNLKNNELFSVDILGNIIIWNVETFTPYQLINIYESVVIVEQKHNKKQVEILKKSRTGSNLFVKALPNVNKFIIYGEKLLIYEKGEAMDPLLCDDNAILGCRYNKKTNDIITFSLKRIKFWNIFNGKIHKIYENLMEDIGITAFEIDKNEKKFYLGDISGRIKCFNLLNGNYIKDYKSHKTEISYIIQSSKYNILITASSDLHIKFHLDKDEEQKSSIIREISAGSLTSFSWKDKITIKNMILDENSQTFIIGLSNGTIIYFDMVHYKFLNNYNNNDKQIDHINKKILSNMKDIKDADCLFVSYENGGKYIMAKNSNKYYLHLSEEKFGYFENDDNNKHDKDIVLTSEYDKISHKLLIGNQTGIITCYDLSLLIEIMNNNNYNSIDSAINDIHEKLYFSIIYRIEAHKESITHINIPYELEPRIFFTTSTDRTLKLYDLNNGNYIDSLKQLSFKSESLPIAIKFIKENPFIQIENKEKLYNELYKDDYEELIKNINNKDNNKIIDNENYVTLTINNNLNENDNLNIIYKELLESKIKEPYVNYNKTYKGEIIKYANKLIEYNAKKKLNSFSFNGLEKNQLKLNASNLWNYQIDIGKIIQKKNRELSLLKEKISNLNKEINDSEISFQHISIFNKNYKPLYLKNLKDEEYDNIYHQINNKIKNIHLGLAKNQMQKKEIGDIINFEKKMKNYNNLSGKLSPISFRGNEINFSPSDKKDINKDRKLKKEVLSSILIKKKKRLIDSKNNFNSLSSQGLYEEKFKEYKNQFNKRYDELTEPIRILFQKKLIKKAKLLPKINITHTQIKNNS